MWLYGIKPSVSVHCLCTGIMIKQGLIFKCLCPVMYDNVTKSFNMNILSTYLLSVTSAEKLMLITQVQIAWFKTWVFISHFN